MLLREFLLPGLLLPGGIAAALYLTTGWLERRRPSGGAAATASGRASIVGGFALAAGYLAAHAAISGLPPLPAAEATDWLFHGVAVSLLLTLLLPSLPVPALEWGARAVIYGGFLWLTSASLREYRWQGSETLLWLPILLALLLALSWAVERMALADARHLAPWAWIVLFGGAAVILGLSGSARLAQLAGVGAAVPGVGWLASWVTGLAALGRGGATVAALVYGGLLFVGFFYAELAPWNAALLVAAPLLAATIAGRVTPPSRALLATLVVVAVLVGIALVGATAQWRAVAADDPYAGWSP